MIVKIENLNSNKSSNNNNNENNNHQHNNNNNNNNNHNDDDDDNPQYKSSCTAIFPVTETPDSPPWGPPRPGHHKGHRPALFRSTLPSDRG